MRHWAPSGEAHREAAESADPTKTLDGRRREAAGSSARSLQPGAQAPDHPGGLSREQRSLLRQERLPGEPADGRQQAGRGLQRGRPVLLQPEPPARRRVGSRQRDDSPPAPGGYW